MKKIYLFFLLLHSSLGFAATRIWQGDDSGDPTNWHVAANWTGSQVPTAADDVVIPGELVNYPKSSTSLSAYCRNLTIDAGGIFTLRHATGSMNIYGDILVNGTLAQTGVLYTSLYSTNGTVGGNGSYVGFGFRVDNGYKYTFQTRVSPYELYEVYVEKGGELVLGNNSLTVRGIYVEGSFSMGSGTLTILGESVIGASEKAPEPGKFNPYFPTGQSGEGTFTPGTGTVYYNGTSNSQFVRSTTYYNLKIGTASGKTTYMANAAGAAVLGSTANGGTMDVNVTNNLEIVGLSTGGIVTTYDAINLTNGTFKLSSDNTYGLTMNLRHQISKAGTATAFTMGANSSNVLNVYYANSSQYAIKNFTSPYTFSGTVRYESASQQLVMPNTYSNLIFDGANTSNLNNAAKTLQSNITVNGNLTLEDKGHLDISSSLYSIDLKGNWASSNSSFNQRTGTVTMSGSNAQSIAFSGSAQSFTSYPGTITTAAIPDNQSNGSFQSGSLSKYAAGSCVVDNSANGLTLGMVEVSITHNYNSEMEVWLVSPTGVAYEMSTDNGGTGSGYSSVFFYDAAAGAITAAASGVLSGTYRPETALSTIPAGLTAGTWRLYAGDDEANDTGTLTAFNLYFLEPSSTETFYNLIVNNTGTSGVSLSNSVSANTLTLTDGLVTTGANRMLVSNSAAGGIVAGAGNSSFSNSWIFGNLRRFVASNTSAYEFPVGTASAVKRAIVTNANMTGLTYLTANFNSTVTGLSPLNATNAKDLNTIYDMMLSGGSWTIDPDVQPTGGSYSIKLYLAGFSGLTNNMFGILKRPSGSNSSTAWTASPGVASIEAFNGDGRKLSDGYARKNGFTSFSEFGIGIASTILPVELQSIEGRQNNDKVEVLWSTATEMGSDYFEVERSEDGKVFQSIAKVKAAGNSFKKRDYVFEDLQPLAGQAFYRVSQTDLGGFSVKSRVLSVNFVPSSHIKLYPNPSEGKVFVNAFGFGAQEKISVTLSDHLGRPLSVNSYVAQNGQLSISLNDSGKLVKGLYIVRISGQSKRMTERFVVQ